MEKREPSYTAGGNVNRCSHYGRTVTGFFKTLKIELLHDPAIPFLGMYLEKTVIQKDIYIPVFTAALFTTAQIWKQSKYPSADEWINKMLFTYTMKYYSAINIMKQCHLQQHAWT